jgi:hypothetical protein
MSQRFHEFEALVLVDVNKIPEVFPDGEADRAVSILKQSIGNAEPELIDDGPDTAPSKRIINAFAPHVYVKASAGPDIVGKIGLHRVRSACPNFNKWITKLENLGSKSNSASPFIVGR